MARVCSFAYLPFNKQCACLGTTFWYGSATQNAVSGMGSAMARTPHSLDEITRNIEQDLIPAGEQSPGDSASEYSYARRASSTDEPGAEPVRPFADIYNKAADDIQSSGQSIIQAATAIAAETDALADLLRKHGASIAGRIEEFSTMSKRVADAVKKGRKDVAADAAKDGSSAPRS